jgi:hypothetical protein
VLGLAGQSSRIFGCGFFVCRSQITFYATQASLSLMGATQTILDKISEVLQILIAFENGKTRKSLI